MNYRNATHIIPPQLLAEIQKYVQGETIYIPKQPVQRAKWGSKSGSRAQLDARNASIRTAFADGATIDELAAAHFLSTETIKKIVYVKHA